MRDLRITLVQTDLVWEDVSANLKHLTEILDTAKPETDLIVLPEMFGSGFSMLASKTAQTMDGEAVNWMQKTALKFNCSIVGSLNIREDEKYYNRLLLVSEEGIQAQYDKRHLFTMAGEQEVYSKGKKTLVCPVAGWKIHFQVCYDLRFPVWARNTDGYDLLINIANWPSRRVYAWNQLLIARAIENQSYVAGVNRVGKDGLEIPYPGNSCVIDPMGELVWRGDEQEVVSTQTLSRALLDETRERLPFLRDRDNFEWR